MLPAESRVTSKVTVALPAPLDSAFAIGGFSFAASSSAENVGLGCPVGDDGESSAHADATSAAANAYRAKRFIVRGFFITILSPSASQRPAASGSVVSGFSQT